MPTAIRAITRIQDADDFDQFQAFPAGVLLMTPDVVSEALIVPAGYTALWPNMAVPLGVTVEAVGLLVDPGWSDALAVLNMGDSKTSGDAWVGLLLTQLQVANTAYVAHVNNVFVSLGGWRSYDLAWVVSELVPGMTGKCELVTLNIGINDASTGTSESDFKAAYRSIIDTLRGRWPNVSIYVAYVWSASLGTVEAQAAINAWIADIVSEYDHRVSVGMDERVWLEGGDNGATNTLDGTHYSTAGQTAAAAAWAAGIGV